MRTLLVAVSACFVLSVPLSAQLSVVGLSVTPERVLHELDEETQFTATATLAGGGIADVTSDATWSSSDPSVATIDATGRLRAVGPGTAVVTATYAVLQDTADVEVLAPGPFAPDPVELAPALSATELTSFADATSFLYSGATPVQTGVAPGAIVPLRTAVVRGIVRTHQGTPLGGVRVSIRRHPEFGSTFTRADGAYDLALNGGTTYDVVFERRGYGSVQRQVYLPWQDYATIHDVAMTRYDAAVTVVTSGTVSSQVARGTSVDDASGQRRATLILPPVTSATMTLPDGSTTELTRLSLRLTEYTVGANGPLAMPAALPPETGYTYCVELSADEAIAAGATTVTFSKPLSFYVENFLGFPIGGIVPAGYYDRLRGAWIASKDGRVVAIVSETGGMADVDASGDGIADSADALTELGIDDDERRRLAELYDPGISLWRVPITHFTPYDLNWPTGNAYEIDPDSETNPAAPSEPPQWSESVDDPAECAGSVVRCENQTLGERIPIAGTPFDLVYESGRVRGRAAERKFRLQVSGTSTPASVTNITVRIEIAGVVTEQSFVPGTPQALDFTWDGRDAYGRIAAGAANARVSVTYTYPAVYFVPTASGRAFAQRSGIRFLTPVLARGPDMRTTAWTVPLGGLRSESAHFGGWTLSPHQLYDYSRRALLMGNGRQRAADLRDLAKYEVSRAVGRLTCCDDGSGVATRTAIDAPYQIGVGADGTLYLNEQSVIRRVTPEGRVERVAGTGRSGYSGDGGPALEAAINARRSVVVGSDGTIYFPDWNNYRVRRITPDGIITTIAGNGQAPEFGVVEENVPATQARVNPQDVAVGPDGTVYIADRYRYIRRISPDGIIHTVTGGGTRTDDGAPAREFRVNRSSLEGLALAPDGALYFAEEGTYGAVLRKIGPDGLVRTIAGAGSHCGYAHVRPYDGPAADACLNKVWFLRAGVDGSVYIADQNASRVRMLTPDGMMRTVAGNGKYATSDRRDSGIATGESITQPFGAAPAPDGSIYFTEVLAYGVIWKLRPIVQRFVDAATYIPSADGSEVYVFNGSRHIRTLDALTGGVLLEFSYDTQQRLIALTDIDGNVTTIERNTAGDLTAIIAPGGQRTTIALDANGYLGSISDPAGNTYTLTHSAAGLLTKLRSPRLLTHTYAYDADGRLEKDTAPDGRSLSLARVGFGDDWTVTSTTSLGRSLQTTRERLADASTRHLSVLSSGLQIDRSTSAGATHVTNPDGVIATSTPRADPRFGTAAPVVSSSIQFPSGRTLSIARARTVTLHDPSDMLSLRTQTDTFTVAGRTSTAAYDTTTRELRITSAAARQTLLRTDAARRPVRVEAAGITAVDLTYTGGLLSTVTSGSRQYTYGYDARRRLVSVTDPLLRQTTFTYDDADRVLTQTLPDQRVITFQYDAAGNVTSVTPPSRPAHAFTFTAGDQVGTYRPPALSDPATLTQYAYDADRQLTTITRPDSSTITFAYDSAGRLESITAPDAAIASTWDANGRLGALSAGGASVTYSYDGSLLTGVSSSGAVAATIASEYDTALRLSGETVNGSAISFSWDADDLLTQAGALALTRDAANGLLTGTTLQGVTDTYTYNGFGEISAYTASYAGTAVYSATYDRDAVGRVNGVSENVAGVARNRDYLYDDAGRLTTVVDGPATLAEYDYDGNSNRLAHRWSGGSAAATYDAQDRMLTYGDTTYEHSANGELQSSTLAGATTSYTYDAFGSLRTVALPGGSSLEYVVDAQNRRVGKRVNRTLVRGWIYTDQLRIVAETDGTGAVVSRFVYGTRSNAPDYMIRDGITYRIVGDHLGSPRLVINTADGTIAQRLDYDEFGNVTSDSNPAFQPFGFAGGLYDHDTRLLRFGARDYDPRTGRWTAKDPILFYGGDTNLYGYVFSDPVNFIDPSGLDALTVCQKTRLGRYFPSIDLDAIEIVPDSNIVPKGFDAITLNRSIHFAPGAYDTYDTGDSIELLAHELTHVQQYETHGLAPFLVKYGLQSLRYRGYPQQGGFETEATDNARNIRKLSEREGMITGSTGCGCQLFQ